MPKRQLSEEEGVVEDVVTIKTMVRGFQNATRGRTYTMSNRAGDEYVLFDRQDKFFGKDGGQ